MSTLKIQAEHTYYTGPQDWPRLSIVVEVTGEYVWHVPASGGTLMQSSLRSFTADADKAGQTMARKTGPYAAGMLARHGAKIAFSDCDRVRATVTWPKELDDAAKRDRGLYDGYGLAKSFGVAGGWDPEARTTTVDLPRADVSDMVAAGLTVLSVETLWACPTNATAERERINANLRRIGSAKTV